MISKIRRVCTSESTRPAGRRLMRCRARPRPPPATPLVEAIYSAGQNDGDGLGLRAGATHKIRLLEARQGRNQKAIRPRSKRRPTASFRSGPFCTLAAGRAVHHLTSTGTATFYQRTTGAVPPMTRVKTADGGTGLRYLGHGAGWHIVRYYYQIGRRRAAAPTEHSPWLSSATWPWAAMPKAAPRSPSL
jgi:hypothetical protein